MRVEMKNCNYCAENKQNKQKKIITGVMLENLRHKNINEYQKFRLELESFTIQQVREVRRLYRLKSEQLKHVHIKLIKFYDDELKKKHASFDTPIKPGPR